MNLKDSFYYLDKLKDLWVVKISLSFFLSIGVLIDDFYMAQQRMIIVMFALMILDMITGITKNRKEFSSLGLRKGIGKIWSYTILIFLGYILQVELKLVGAEQFMYFYIIITETISITENLRGLGYPVPILDNLLDLIRGLNRKK